MRNNHLTILGISISTDSRSAIAERLREWLTERTPKQIVTVNPEILVATTRNSDYRQVIQAADERLTDGAGILFVTRLFGLPAPERFTGVELVDTLAELTAQLGRSIYLIGGDPGVAEAAAQALQRRHPSVRIAGAEEGVPRLTDQRFQALEPEKSEDQVVARIAATKPAVVLVAYGHPKQELFIARRKHELAASVLVGVGGTFDFLAGVVPRAPRVVQALWLEWLWRLIVQPQRIGRIWTATVVFPWLVLKERFTNHDVRVTDKDR